MKRITLAIATLALLAGSAFGQYLPASPPSDISRGLGVFYAPNYAYGFGAMAPARVQSGNSATGSQTITLQMGLVTLPDGRTDMPFNVNAPILVGNGTNQETVTPTAVSGCYEASILSGSQGISCNITASFSNLHGQGEIVQSGTFGSQEAINDAFSTGGGQVVIDTFWAGGYGSALQGTNAILTAATGFPSVGIVDYRGNATQYWNLLPTVTTFLAAPTTLTSSTAFSSASASCTPSGSCYTGGTIHVCIAYVDLAGNEGPCSADYSFTDTSAKAIQFTAPAASAGAVGYVLYVGLESGSAKNEYNIPLVTQPTVIGAAPVSNGVCTLTTVETILPACAVANTTYGQTGSGAVAIVYPVVTSQQAFQLGGVSTTSYYAPNVEAHTVYSYVPGSHPGLNGVVSSNQPATISAALASTVPFVLGSVQIPPQFMNYVGREIEICGQIVDAAGGANTITAIQFWWDADGSNVTTGIPVYIGGPKITTTQTNVAYNWNFCQDIETTVASASATGGSLRSTLGWETATAIAAGTAPTAGTNIGIAAIGSLNLAGPARIDIVYVETTGTTDTPLLSNVTVKVIN